VEQTAKMVAFVPVAVQIDAPCLTQKFADKYETLERELQILIIAPDVPILLFLKGCLAALRLMALQLNRLFIFRLRVKRRVDVNKINLAPKLLQQVTHHLQ